VRLNDNSAALPSSPRNVYIKERDACLFKQMLAGDVGMPVMELSTYTKMYATKLAGDVRVSCLHGFVADEQTSRIVGLLLSYIDCKNKTLSCAPYANDRKTHDI
jgi:hypothetical protein